MSDMRDPAADHEPEIRLDPRVQEAIGRSLKAHYDDLVSAPIPDKFLVLLAQLEMEEQRLATGTQAGAGEVDGAALDAPR